MKNHTDMWKELDDAVVAGFITHMEDFTGEWGRPLTKHYGTKIIFNGKRTTPASCRMVAEYIQNEYGFEVDCPFSYCVIIWEKT